MGKVGRFRLPALSRLTAVVQLRIVPLHALTARRRHQAQEHLNTRTPEYKNPRRKTCSLGRLYVLLRVRPEELWMLLRTCCTPQNST